MIKKNDLAPPTYGWGEVILGAGLSVMVGAVLGALAVVLMPTVTAEELPKKPVAGVKYFIEGSRGTNQGTQAAAKRKVFSEGATGGGLEYRGRAERVGCFGQARGRAGGCI
jgi:hypothetical protein